MISIHLFIYFFMFTFLTFKYFLFIVTTLSFNTTACQSVAAIEGHCRCSQTYKRSTRVSCIILLNLTYWSVSIDLHLYPFLSILSFAFFLLTSVIIIFSNSLLYIHTHTRTHTHRELKKLDDKQMLTETHLTESRIYHSLQNIPKGTSSCRTFNERSSSVTYFP